MRGPSGSAPLGGGPVVPGLGFFKWLFLYPFLFGVAVIVLQALVMAQ